MSDFNTLFYYKREDGTWSDDLSGWANRAFLFGDGIFETMIFIHGQIRFSKYHMQRLQEGMEVLGIYPDRLTSLDSLEHFLCELPVSNESLRVRWNIYREGLGKYAPDDNFSKETLQIEPLKKTGTVKFNSYISQGVYTPQTYWSHCKTLSALTYVMASKEKIIKGYGRSGHIEYQRLCF
jgi:4-amino-4-deoxychorismate lyase